MDINDRDIFYELIKKMPDWKERFQDYSFWEQFFESATDKMFEVKHEDDVQKIIKCLYQNVALRNIKISFQLAESPIEKIFLSQVVIAFFMWNPLSLLIIEPNFYERYEKAIKNEKSMRELAKEEGKTMGKTSEKLLQSKEFSDSIIIPLLYRDMNCFDAVHMFPQINFSGISQINPKFQKLENIRVDILFMKLNDERFRLVVECDGYEWHKDKFTADRQRDRLLREAGFDIFRFSGSEIIHNPIECALQLQQYIQNKWEFKYLFQNEDK